MKLRTSVQALVLTASGGVAMAQDLEPRAFSNSQTRHQSVKPYALQGYDTTMERDLNAFGIAWQCRSGGGY
jgi:hypothetical protein